MKKKYVLKEFSDTQLNEKYAISPLIWLLRSTTLIIHISKQQYSKRKIELDEDSI